MKMSTEELAELEQLARNAEAELPGTWQYLSFEDEHGAFHDVDYGETDDPAERYSIHDSAREAGNRYLAAVQPQRILALIQELRAARGETSPTPPDPDDWELLDAREREEPLISEEGMRLFRARMARMCCTCDRCTEKRVAREGVSEDATD